MNSSQNYQQPQSESLTVYGSSSREIDPIAWGWERLNPYKLPSKPEPASDGNMGNYFGPSAIQGH